MAKAEQTGRWKQRRRTRQDILAAAAELLKKGHRPSLEEIADAALVSRATAYRYFPNADALLVEAALEIEFPKIGEVLEGAGDDAVQRTLRVDAALHALIRENEVPLRLMIASALERGARGDLPVRQDRRTPMLEEALAPARASFNAADFKALIAALSLVVGPEAMIVFRDVLRLDDAEATRVRRWAIEALIAAAR
ncbi:TetR/AcrR family transcriptional regulator [Sphingosinicella microcystinivorans]|uniref:TetR family transcriptional regulator n=1 Tax=Sphingosinicella microcystinivorans TaxID=335406 RepID=A0AAD1G190_SPHMI|nr:TetR/AcrR family transcriptional regulator [Sphingosinicella microcystinivorans]RKS91458.1 TetR family transcriptional regulator [Sphingosinicella microcystinivorans]BBE34435.1 TetR family transcriptional regulator [Sphingosinicella microcystinivorans]